MNWIRLAFLCLLIPSISSAQAGESMKKDLQKIEPVKIESTKKRSKQAAVQDSYVPARAGNAITPDYNSEMLRVVPGVANTQAELYHQGAYWLNEYNSTRNNALESDGYINPKSQEALERIVAQSRNYIAGSFEYEYLQLRQHRNRPEGASHLKSALKKVNTLNALLQPEAAWIAERSGDKSTRNTAIDAMIKSGQITALQLQMARWQQEVAAKGALLVVNGEHDLYPLWSDDGKEKITVLSLGMAEDLEYIRRSLKSWDDQLPVHRIKATPESILQVLADHGRKPIYVSLSVRPEWLAPHVNYLHPVGPLALMSKQATSTLEANKQFYLNKELLAYLFSPAVSNDTMRASLANLLPGLWMLKNYAGDLSEAQFAELEKISQRITQLTGKNIR